MTWPAVAQPTSPFVGAWQGEVTVYLLNLGGSGFPLPTCAGRPNLVPVTFNRN
jgi:hypothetical protein